MARRGYLPHLIPHARNTMTYTVAEATPTHATQLLRFLRRWAY